LDHAKPIPPFWLTNARYLLAEKHFSKIDIFEQRSTVSGVWNYTSKNEPEDSFSIPQTTPETTLDKPISRCSKSSQTPSRHGLERYATFVSPMYDRLEANLPKMLMQHSDMGFAAHDQLFPKHETIEEYLKRYADDVWRVQYFSICSISYAKRSLLDRGNCFSCTSISFNSILLYLLLFDTLLPIEFERVADIVIDMPLNRV